MAGNLSKRRGRAEGGEGHEVHPRQDLAGGSVYGGGAYRAALLDDEGAGEGANSGGSGDRADLGEED